jgi:asparagine synthase (glutamine-hydrolysing)
LSGGIDSSLVTALAAKSRGAQGINSFSIAIDNGKYNEGKFAKAVSQHLGTAHHEFVVKEKEVLELIDRFLPAYDEPFADSSAFPTMMVSRLARQQVTVALSGDGGDELFHGYGMYQWAKRLAHPLLPIFGKPAYAATRLMNNRFQRLGHLFDIPSNQQKLSHIFSQEQYYFKQQELDRLLIYPTYNFSEINRLPKTSRILSPEEQQSLWDFRYYLKDDLLVKVDRASMQYSLESRVPLLDYRVVNFALNLHPTLKIQGGKMKYLLKEILFQYVPKEIFDRPKWGFSIPLDKWLQTDLRYLLEQYTDARIIEKHGLVNNEEVQLIKKLYFKGANYLYNRLWTLVVLHWWLETRPAPIAPRP